MKFNIAISLVSHLSPHQLAELLIQCASAFFFGMGVVALLFPNWIAALFGTHELAAAARNEYRAVYGGFGVAVAVALNLIPVYTQYIAGAVLMSGAMVFGMAGGRVVSLFTCGDGWSLIPLLFFIVELALSGLFFVAFGLLEGKIHITSG